MTGEDIYDSDSLASPDHTSLQPRQVKKQTCEARRFDQRRQAHCTENINLTV